MKTKWLTSQDGGSGTWLYVRLIGARAYQMIEILDMWDATGDDSGFRYCAEVLVVDLDVIPTEQIEAAKRSCGWEDFYGNPVTDDDAIAEMCYSYGCKAILWSDSGNSRSRLEREARSEAKALLEPYAMEAAMDRPVNAIGSTAREYMQGDITSAVLRGVAEGDPRAELLLKMRVK